MLFHLLALHLLTFQTNNIMVRKVGNREYKPQGGVMIVGEGMTEWYYLQSLKGLISSEVNPKVSEHKDGIGYIEKKIKECIDKGADTVICLIDMDNKQSGASAEKYQKFKAKYHKKSISGKTTKNRAIVELYENFPCTEMWFYYYFQYSTANICSCSETLNKMKPHWSNYKKVEAYFKTLPGGIHSYIVNQLGGNLNTALINSVRSNKNRTEQNSGAYCEMKMLFDKILRDDSKQQLSVYDEKKIMEIHHNKQERKFLIEEQGLTAYLLYSISGDTLTVTSTYVPGPLEGQGIAAALTKECYAYATTEGLKPDATYSYAVAWLKRHSN